MQGAKEGGKVTKNGRKTGVPISVRGIEQKASESFAQGEFTP
jgi:hypothetical protein